MKKFARLIFAGMLLLLCTACQPTPEEEIVRQKGAENEQKWMEPVLIQETEVSISEGGLGDSAPREKKHMAVPDHWEEKLDLREDLKVEIQADITVRNTTTFPIYAVEPMDFNPEKLDSVVKKLYPNARLQIKAGRKSKEDLEYEMEIETKAVENVDNNHPEFTEEEREAYIAEAQEHLQTLLKQLQALENGPAPEVAERVSAYVRREDGLWTAVFEPIDEKTNSKLGIINLNTAPKEEPDDTTMKIVINNRGGLKVDGEILQPDINDFEAVRTAGEKLLCFLGLDDEYEVDRVFQDKNVYQDATFVYCTRKIGEARITYVESYSQLQEGAAELAYAPALEEEIVRFLFWSYGCDGVIWSGPTKMGVVENENAKLLPFETIQEKARKAFGRIMYPGWGGDGDKVLYYRIIINDIRLGYMNIKRAGGGYSTIPVWDFFGYYYGGYASQESSGWADLDENNEHMFSAHGGATSMLTLNAIDGSIVRRAVGY